MDHAIARVHELAITRRGDRVTQEVVDHAARLFRTRGVEASEPLSEQLIRELEARLVRDGAGNDPSVLIRLARVLESEAAGRHRDPSRALALMRKAVDGSGPHRLEELQNAAQWERRYGFEDRARALEARFAEGMAQRRAAFARHFRDLLPG